MRVRSSTIASSPSSLTNSTLQEDYPNDPFTPPSPARAQRGQGHAMLLFLSCFAAVGEIWHPLHRRQQGTHPGLDGRSLENAQTASACAGPARQRHGFAGCCAQGLLFLLLVLGMDTCTLL